MAGKLNLKYSDVMVEESTLKFTKTTEDRDGISVIKGKVIFTNGQYLLCNATIKRKVNDESEEGHFDPFTAMTPSIFWQWLELLVWENRVGA